MRKLFLIISLLVVPLASAQELHTFSNGEVADAEKINENFEALKRPTTVISVAQNSHGDFLLLSDALASITDASESKPYLIKIAPGVYKESNTVNLKSHVSIEGSGTKTTSIMCSCADDDFLSSSTLKATNVRGVSISNLKIINAGGSGSKAYALLNYLIRSEELSLSNVSVSAYGTATVGGIANETSSVRMKDIEVDVQGGQLGIGIYSARSTASIYDSRVNVSSALALAVDYLLSSGDVNRLKATAQSTSEGSQSRAFSLNSSSLNISESTLRAVGASEADLVAAVFFKGVNEQLLLRSVDLRSENDALKSERDNMGSIVVIMNSVVDGEIDGNGVEVSCFNSVDAQLNALSIDCT